MSGTEVTGMDFCPPAGVLLNEFSRCTMWKGRQTACQTCVRKLPIPSASELRRGLVLLKIVVEICRVTCKEGAWIASRSEIGEFGLVVGSETSSEFLSGRYAI